MDRKYEEYAAVFEKIFGGDVKPEEMDNRDDSLDDADMRNTSIADYVWLPLRFEGDMFILTGRMSGGLRIMSK